MNTLDNELENFLEKEKTESENTSLNEEKTEEKTETSKEKFIRMFNSIRHISPETKESILAYLESTDFYTAPASTKFHSNFPEGLVQHSINVAETLLDFTNKHNLKWEHEDSPLVVGLLHDICKIYTYTQVEKSKFLGKDEKTKKNLYATVLGYNFDNKLPHLGVHGDKSVAFLLMLQRNNDFTLQELTCIRYHMGVTQESDVSTFNQMSHIEPLVVWTNVADTIASLTEKIVEI